MPKSAKPSVFSKLYALSALLFDKRTPKLAKWIIVASLLYTIFPIDIIPDFLVGVGWLDDLSTLIAASIYFWQKTKHLIPKN